MNYFELFDFEPQFELDAALLSVRFHELQRRFHPDNFVQETSLKQRQASQHSAQINDAYQTLRDPLLRAIYLLSLTNIDLSNQRSFSDKEFLFKQLAFREQLEVAADQKDEARLHSLSEEVNAQYQALLKNVGEKLQQKEWEHALQLVQQGQFIKKLLDEIAQTLQRLF
ncbi:MAG: Fe-S protein assembly co-chaperone HscB [Vibrionaceae bacterium]